MSVTVDFVSPFSFIIGRIISRIVEIDRGHAFVFIFIFVFN